MARLPSAAFPLLAATSAVTAAVLVNACATRLAVTVPDAAAARFDGVLLALSDADQIGTAYADGNVGKLAGIEDSLTIIRLDSLRQPVCLRAPASNSVISWPAVLAVSPDGRLAYVAETRAPFPEPVQQVPNVWESVPPGRQMTVVDLATGQAVQTAVLGLNLGSASVNAAGSLLAAASAEPGKEIAVAVLRNGLIDTVHHFPCEALHNAEQSRNPYDNGVKTLAFSPAGNVAAVNLHNKSVVFYEVLETGRRVSLRQIGAVLPVARNWSAGHWTPDGRFFILTDVNWGPSPLFGATLNRPGSLISVRFDAGGRHEVVSRAQVGLSPEGFDLSPAGDLAVVVNMRRTYLPQGLPYVLFGARGQASLSLVRVDPATGALQVLGSEYGFEGELPEDAAFDADGNTVAVAVYHARYEQQPRRGFVEFWRVADGRLIRTRTRVAVTRGVHTLKRAPESSAQHP
jgi:DNA-binding beta-propeller fold protein YncE